MNAVMTTRRTTSELFATGTLAALVPLGALLLAFLMLEFVPVALAHPVASAATAALAASVLFASAGTGGVVGRGMTALAVVTLPLLALTAVVVVVPLLADISVTTPDMGALVMPEVPGYVWLALGLLVVGVLVGCGYTHDRAWGVLGFGPLALLAVVLVLFAGAGNVPGLPGAREPHLRAVSERAVGAMQEGSDDASDAWYDGATGFLTGLTQ